MLFVFKENDEAKILVKALREVSAGTQAGADFFSQNVPTNHPARVSRIRVGYRANGSRRIDEKKLRVRKVVYLPGKVVSSEHIRAVTSVGIGELPNF